MENQVPAGSNKKHKKKNKNTSKQTPGHVKSHLLFDYSFLLSESSKAKDIPPQPATISPTQPSKLRKQGKEKEVGRPKEEVPAVPQQHEVKHKKGKLKRHHEDASTPSGPAKKAKPLKEQPSGKWPFKTNFNDHFETSLAAIADLEPALYRLARLIGKPKESLTIYDPYYCKGSIRQHYSKLGFKHFVHENRDFYRDIAAGTVPDYDILITNPPYSDDHKERILSFCLSSGKPFALLMPNYIANKQYYQELVGSTYARADDQPFYLVPTEKYEYEHPEGAGHSSSPFFSIWFVQLGKDTQSVYKWWSSQPSPIGKLGKTAGSKGLEVLRSMEQLQEEKKVPTWKRPNPKQRRRLRQKTGG